MDTSPPSLAVRPPPQSKDGLIRMLLQSAQPNPPTGNNTPPSSSAMGGTTRFAPPTSSTTPMTSYLPSPNSPIRIMPPTSTPMHTQAHPIPVPYFPSEERQISALGHLAGCDREISLVALDHPYAKPWNWRPDSMTVMVKPTKHLFIHKGPRHPPNSTIQSDILVDVVTEDAQKCRAMDLKKASCMMSECERHANFANPAAKKLAECEEWEEKISKEGWSTPKHRLFNKALKILHADQLARLAFTSHSGEPVSRRLLVDKTAKRLRFILAGVVWDAKLTQWLHDTLCDNLPQEYLVSYMDALQTLRAKIPGLVDKMTSGRVINENYGSIAREGVRILMKRRWDPVARTLEEQRMKKIPGSPILIFTPSGPNDIWHKKTLRARRWLGMMGQLGKFVLLHYPPLDKNGKTEIGSYLQLVVSAVISKIRDFKRGNADRQVVLIGWGVGAAINCQVAAMESVSAIVNLGFSMFTLDGPRGEMDDPIFDLRTPTLFVVGQNAAQSRPDDIEDMRERMRCENGLIVVGGGDDSLRVSRQKKTTEGITQTMVDRCIVDDVREFIVAVFTTPAPTFAIPSHPGIQSAETPTGNKRGRRRKYSVKDENGTPTPKKIRKNAKNSAKPMVTSSPIAMVTSSSISLPQNPMPMLPTSPVPISMPNQPNVSVSSSPSPLLEMPPMPPSILAAATSTPPIAPPALLNSSRIMGAEKARKVLDMNQPEELKLMASSPLLSSALTSPTKSPSPAPSPRPVQTTMAPARLPNLPITFPTMPTPPAPTVLPSPRPQTVVHPPMSIPTMPNIASMLSNTSHMLSQPVMRPNTPTSVMRMVSPRLTKTGGSPMVVLSQSSRKQSPRAQTTRMKSPGVRMSNAIKRATVTTNATSKDNYYFVALQPDQMKNSRNLVQYATAGGQMLTLVNPPTTSTAATTFSNPTTGGDNNSKGKSKSGTATPDTPGTVERQNVAEILASLSGLNPEPQTKTKTKTPATLVANSGTVTNLVTAVKSAPPPNDTKTSTGATTTTKNMVARPTAAILSSSAAGNSRIVRVIQSGSSTTGSTSTTVHRAQSSTQTGQARSRKQVFVTTTSSPIVAKSLQPSTATATSSTTTTTTATATSSTATAVATTSKSKAEEKEQKVNASKVSKAVAEKASDKPVEEPSENEHQDILEEDVSDLDYAPVKKKSSSPSGNKKTNAKNVKK